MKFTNAAFRVLLSGALLVPTSSRLSSSSTYNEDADIHGCAPSPHVALGTFHSCAIQNLDRNNLKCWGYNAYGQVGDSTTVNRSLPTTIRLGGDGQTRVTQIALGASHSCFIDNAYNLKCWGFNKYGQLGDGTTVHKSVPTTISLGDDGTTYATQLSLGSRHSCGIDNLDNLKCWGGNGNGQLGDGTTVQKNVPTTISLDNDGTTHATQVALGDTHSCAIDNLNNLKCWGWNHFGQVGDGTTVNKSVPTTISLGDDGRTHATQVALGGRHSCAITNFKNLKCWGANYFGQVGDGTTVQIKNVPTTISLGDDGTTTHATQVSLGFEHSCTIDNLDNLKCWGSNEFRQLGDGATVNKSVPTTISLGDDETTTHATQVSLGGFHSCAINESNIFCWGSDSDGQVGDGHRIKEPTAIISLLDTQPFSNGENNKEETALN